MSSLAPDDGGAKSFVLDAVPALLRTAGWEPTPVEVVEESCTLAGGAFWPAREVRNTQRTPQGTAWTLGDVRWPAVGFDYLGNEVHVHEVEVSVALRPAPFEALGAPHPRVVLLRPGTSAIARSTSFTSDDSIWVPLDEGTERSAPLWPLLADVAGRFLTSRDDGRPR